jgi:hypothetical protein
VQTFDKIRTIFYDEGRVEIWRHDMQHDSTEHNDKNIPRLGITTLSSIKLSKTTISIKTLGLSKLE